MIVCLALLAMLGASLGISRISASVRIETLFSENSKILNDYGWLEDHVGSLRPDRSGFDLLS